MVPAGHGRGSGQDQQQRGDQGAEQCSEHDRLGVEAGDGQRDGGHRSYRQRDHFDQADPAEVEPAPEHAARHRADAGEQEDGRDHQQQLGRVGAEEGLADRLRESEGEAGEDDAGEQAGEHRGLDVGAPDRLALHQGAAEALEGEDDRQRHEDQRHDRLAKAGRRDQARQHDCRSEGDHFDSDSGGGCPAHAGYGGVLELLG